MINDWFRRIADCAWLIPICSTIVISAPVWGAPPRIPDAFPLAMSFSPFDRMNANSNEFKQRLEEQAPYPWLHESRPGADHITDLVRKRWPEKIITLQHGYGGMGFVPVWPGHLLYKAGTLITRDVKPTDTEIPVAELERVVQNAGALRRSTKKAPYAVVLYALDSQGRPDWSKAEQVSVSDLRDGKLMVKRGQWGTTAHSYQRGSAVAAAHMMFWGRQWQVNLSLHSPRGGPGNLSGAEWFAQEVGQRLRKSRADGIEFDVARWTFGNPKWNTMDVNNDRNVDYGYINGVNSFGLGGQVFFRELRRILGPDKLVQADSNNALSGMRGWKYLNGVQIEEFPAANDFQRFSESFLHLRLWVDNAEASPRVSYPFTKTPTTTYARARLPNGASTDFRFRVGLAAACLTGMPHPFLSIDDLAFDPENDVNEAKATSHRILAKWDEYRGGELNKWGWLGRPIGAARQDLSALGSQDLLAGSQWEWKVESGFTAQTSKQGVLSAMVRGVPEQRPAPQLWFGVRLQPAQDRMRLNQGDEYTLEFEAQGDDNWRYLNQVFDRVPRTIVIGGLHLSRSGQPMAVLADGTWRTYRLSFTAGPKTQSRPAFGVSEQVGSTSIRNIKLRAGGAERWSREFEHGAVFLNMTKQAWKVGVRPGQYGYLKGVQSPEFNSGKSVAAELLIPPNDAVFLVKAK